MDLESVEAAVFSGKFRHTFLDGRLIGIETWDDETRTYTFLIVKE